MAEERLGMVQRAMNILQLLNVKFVEKYPRPEWGITSHAKPDHIKHTHNHMKTTPDKVNVEHSQLSHEPYM